MKTKQQLLWKLQELLNWTEEWNIVDIEYQLRGDEEYVIITQPGEYKVVANITEDDSTDIIRDIINTQYARFEDYEHWIRRMNLDIELEDEIDEMLEMLDKEVYANEV